MFEIVIWARNSKGEVINSQQKSYRTNSAFDLFTWFNKNSFVPRKKKRRDGGATSKEDSKKLLKKIYGDRK